MEELQLFSKPVKLKYDQEAFSASAQVRCIEEGLAELEVTLQAIHGPALPKLDIDWTVDCIDVQGQWHPQSRDTKHLMPPWANANHAHLFSNAPVFSLYNLNGINRVTFAISDCVTPTEVFCAVDESIHSKFKLAARVCPEENMPADAYSVVVRVDMREEHYARSLEDVTRWWESLGYAARKIPAAARDPIFSSWYVFHQEDLSAEELYQEAKLARELGCKSVIIDSGWAAGADEYTTTGDWIPGCIADMKAMADRLHQIDMRLILWYSLTFIGDQTQAWKSFQDMIFDQGREDKCFDFRYPQTREYMASTFENAIKDYGLDGFKIDFIDTIPRSGFDEKPGDPRRDTQSRAIGVQRILDDILQRLQRVNPDVLIEFRQAYIGPVMRKYATMFRAFDCPQDPVNNRILTTDIRLLAGSSMTHSDMFIWHVGEPVEDAALHFANIFFSVPQISVKISALPEDHKRMLGFYLTMWNAYRDTILDGVFTPVSTECHYPALMVEDDQRFIAGLYSPLCLQLPAGKKEYLLINATSEKQLAVRLAKGDYKTTVYDCMGQQVGGEEINTGSLCSLEIPKCGFWIAKPISR